MTKAITAWAVRFYKKGLGLNSTNLSGDEQLYERKYQELFLEPLKIMTGNNLSADVMNRIITHLNNKSPHQWQYILKFIVDNNLFSITDTFEKDWNKVLDALNNNYTKRVATVYPLTGNDIEVYVDNSGHVVGDYPEFVYIYPSALKTHVNGRYVQDLLKKDLTRISTNDRNLLVDLVELKLLTEDQITVDVNVPVANGNFESMSLPVTDVRVPPAEVLQLIGNLPSTLISENGNDAYAALRSYALTVDVSSVVSDYLNNVISDHFGDTIDGVVAEVIDVPQEDAEVEYFQGTLDELISNYCTKENIDTKCTIEQLIHYINYECTIKPVTLQEQMASYKAENDINGGTTFDEFISGTKHKHIDLLDYTISCIKDNECIPVDIQEALVTCLLNDTDLVLPNNNDNYGQYLLEAGLDLPLVQDILTAIKNKTKIDMNKFGSDLLTQQLQTTPVLADDLRELIISASRTNTPLSIKDVFLRMLPSLELPADTMSRISIAARNNTPYEPAPEKVVTPVPIRESYDELGYNAGEILLRETRMSISEDASFPNRERLTPVLYSFLRLLMCDMSKEKDDVREFLNNKMKGVDSSTAEIIKKALNEIK